MLDATALLATLAQSRATIVGLAREGRALARFLAELGASVTVTDLRTEGKLRESVQQLADLPIRYALGEHPASVLQTDVLFLSPGVPLTAPIVREAVALGVPVTTETRLFHEVCQAPITAITGSSGKTTTTTLVGEMCRADGRKTWVGGNIGQPLIERVGEIRPQDAVVMELSSFQLDLYGPWNCGRGAERFPLLARGLSPHIAAILNITPNHLDRHGTMEAYISAKSNIVRFQSSRDWAILGRDNPVTRGMRSDVKGSLLEFSLGTDVETGAFLRNGRLILRADGDESDICDAADIKLLGEHNLANVLAASAISAAAGVAIQSMTAAATQFAGVEHRLELVRELAGVRYYNDSIATTPERAIAALKALHAPIILLAGGRDKHLPWETWADVVAAKARHVLLFGECAEMIERVARRAWQRTPTVSTTLEHCGALGRALARAQELASPGDIVLLSPGGTSFDAYRDFEARGKEYKDLVSELK